MELEISLQVLQQAEKELNNCCRITQNCAEGMREVLVSIEKNMSAGARTEMQRGLKGYEENIRDSRIRLKRLCSGLKQIEEIYGQYEKEMMSWQEKLR